VRRRTCVGLGVLLSVGFLASSHAQWIYYPDPSLPRLDGGALDVDAPTPRMANDQPDFSGLWEQDNPLQFLGNIASTLEGGLPLSEWGREIYDQRVANLSADDPNNFCMPTGPVEKHAVPAPFKIVQRPDLLVMLYESRTIYRQIFTDGRPFPEDMNPAWYGYSVGHWEGDTLVVESRGFNGRFWLDGSGAPATEELKVIEKFSRPSFGRFVVEMTIDDPQAYTEPWTVTESMHYLPDTDLIEHICYENNRFPDQIGVE